MKCPRCNHDAAVETNLIKREGQQAYHCQHCDDVFLDHGEKPKPVEAERVRKVHRRGPSFTMPPPRETGAKINEPVIAVAAKCPDCGRAPKVVSRGKSLTEYNCHRCDLTFVGPH